MNEIMVACSIVIFLIIVGVVFSAEFLKGLQIAIHPWVMLFNEIKNRDEDALLIYGAVATVMPDVDKSTGDLKDDSIHDRTFALSDKSA